MENRTPKSFFKRSADAETSENQSGSEPVAEKKSARNFDAPREDRSDFNRDDERGERREFKKPERRDGDRDRGGDRGGFSRGGDRDRGGDRGGFSRGGDRDRGGDRGGFSRGGDRDRGGDRGGFSRGGDRDRGGDRGGFNRGGDRDRGGDRGGFSRGGDRDRGGDRGGFKRDFDRDGDRGGFKRDFRDGDAPRKPRYEEPAPLQAPENLIFGIHPVKEALEAGQVFEKIYVKRDTDSAEGIIEYAEAKGIQVQYVPIEKLDKLTRRNNHQGVVAVIPAIEYADFNEIVEAALAQEKPALFVVLDGITDVRNFGAIARTAECVGADAIIVGAKNAAPVNAEAMKTSAGALASIPVCRVGSLRNTLKGMQMQGVKLVAATEKSVDLLYETKLTGSVAVVMGSEETGVSVDILRICDQKVAIPLLGKIESLNVSAAAAVMLYEIVRQRFEEL